MPACWTMSACWTVFLHIQNKRFELFLSYGPAILEARKFAPDVTITPATGSGKKM